MKRVSYVIYKKTEPGLGEAWDHGPTNKPFTLAQAVRTFRDSYSNGGSERSQDFRIVKVTEESLPVQKSWKDHEGLAAKGGR